MADPDRGGDEGAQGPDDKTGKVTLRHRTCLHHIGIGRAHADKRVIMLIDGLDVRVLSEERELLRHLRLDPTRAYQPRS